MEICRDETFAAGLKIELDLAAPDHSIEGDFTRIMQITWNLIRNAAKFTPAGGTLTIRQTIGNRGSRAESGRLIIEFEDTGQGISQGSSTGFLTPSSKGGRTCARAAADWGWASPSAGRWPRPTAVA